MRIHGELSPLARNTLAACLMAAILVLAGWFVIGGYSAAQPPTKVYHCDTLYNNYTKAYNNQNWDRVDILWSKGVQNGCFHND